MFKPHKIPKHLLMEPQRQRRPWWLKLLLFVVLVAVMLVAVAIADMARAESQELVWGQHEPDSEGSGMLLFKSFKGVAQALHLHTDIQVHINGMVAEVVMKQQFQNPSKDYLEGIYVFPLQEKTAVNGMVMMVGERRIVGRIKEKQKAKRIYQKAKREGKRAVLTQQHRPNLFQQSIANIAPGDTITVELRYIQPVGLQLLGQKAQFSLRIPTTITPRYFPKTSKAEPSRVGLAANGWGQLMAEHQQAQGSELMGNARLSQQKNPMSLSITLRAGLPLATLETPYHRTVIDKQGEQHELHLAEGTQAMDRDFLLQWQPVSGHEPQAAFFLQSKEQQDFALLMVQPPQPGHGSLATMPRELVFIIDTSGSMDGESIRQAKAGLLLALDSLSHGDRFNIIEFNNQHRLLFPKTVKADQQHLAIAKDFVQNLESGGGTEMLQPLLAALSAKASPGYIKQVVFITDGAVANENALFELIHQNLDKARLFTVAIGSAPNRFFMRKAAEYGRGSYTSIAVVSELEEKISALFKRLSSPVLSNIHIEWPKHLKVDAWPKRVPDLYAGEPLMVYAKLSDKNATDALRGEIRVSASFMSADGQLSPWQKTVVLAEELDSDNKGIASLWAREKINDLMDQKVRGAKAQAIKTQVTAIALRQQLLSAYTSFIAVEDSVSRPSDRALSKQIVSNSLAKGQRLTSVPYPATATSARANILLGVLLLLLILLWRLALFAKSVKGGLAHA